VKEEIGELLIKLDAELDGATFEEQLRIRDSFMLMLKERSLEDGIKKEKEDV
jgi:hypothetical protein